MSAFLSLCVGGVVGYSPQGGGPVGVVRVCCCCVGSGDVLGGVVGSCVLVFIGYSVFVLSVVSVLLVVLISVL